MFWGKNFTVYYSYVMHNLDKKYLLLCFRFLQFHERVRDSGPLVSSTVLLVETEVLDLGIQSMVKILHV